VPWPFTSPSTQQAARQGAAGKEGEAAGIGAQGIAEEAASAGRLDGGSH